jgi:hypothetical protein
MNGQRGSALLTAILVLLILSAVGAAAVFLMREESTQSASVADAKLALYAAENGLRRGEAVLSNVGAFSINTLLQHDSSGDPATPAMTPQRPRHPTDPKLSGTYDVAHLGTYLISGGTPLAVQQVQIPVQGTGPARDVFYSLCVRDNPEDITATSPNSNQVDSDAKVRLISVGWVQGGNRVLAVKVLEEEYNFTGVSQSSSAQKLVNAGGTSSVLFGG